MTVQDLYDERIKPLTPPDRLRLASLILNDLARSDVDVSTLWSDQDLAEFSQAGWARAEQQSGENGNGEGR